MEPLVPLRLLKKPTISRLLKNSRSRRAESEQRSLLQVSEHVRLKAATQKLGDFQQLVWNLWFHYANIAQR